MSTFLISNTRVTHTHNDATCPEKEIKTCCDYYYKTRTPGRKTPTPRVSVNPEDNTLITHLYNVTVRQPTILARLVHQFKGKLWPWYANNNSATVQGSV